MKRTTALISFLASVMIMAGCAIHSPVRDPAPAPTKVERITYHGWTNSLRLSNERVEVVVVPQVGRIMSFRFLDGENVFWEDRSLDGRRGDWESKEWVNFGGEKTWPAPEADWIKYTRRKEWRPPPAFDAWPVEARVEGGEVVMTSSIDPFYGVRTTRRLKVYFHTLHVTTSYERLHGEPAKIGVWTIAQFREPVAVYVPVITNSIFGDGYFKFDNQPWSCIERKDNYLKITRDPKAAHKMGCDAYRFVWVGEKEKCSVVTLAPRPPGGEYPDRGASAEVYTNPDPKKYVELELLGPLSLMKPGDRINFTNRYSLWRRSKADPDADARWLLR